MLAKTPAIVLSVVKHSDKSSVLHAYTRASGRASFILYGHKFRPAPLSLVEITYDHLPTRDIQTIKSIALSDSPVLLTEEEGSLTRQCVSLFVAEMLLSVFRHPLEDPEMYDFLALTIRDIYSCPDPENSHLRFLVGLSSHLGFGEPEFCYPSSRLERQQTLRSLLTHFSSNIEGFLTPTSLDILTEIFD